MSENQNRGNRDFSVYDDMTTEELEQILRLDAEAPEGQASDGELLLYVMEVLAKRKKNSDNPGKTAQKAWESFQQHYLPEEEACVPQIHKEKKTVKPFTPWLRRLTAAAAVVALVVCLSATANAFSWKEMWNAVAKWAKETFSFVAVDDPQTTEPSVENVKQYQSLQQALQSTDQEYGIVPTWIPERYKLDELIVDETPIQKNYIAIYATTDGDLRISVRSYIENDPEKVEIDENLIEVFEKMGVKYYIFENMDQRKVVWIKDSYECCISGDVTIEEIKMMIDSIGKG